MSQASLVVWAWNVRDAYYGGGTTSTQLGKLLGQKNWTLSLLHSRPRATLPPPKHWALTAPSPPGASSHTLASPPCYHLSLSSQSSDFLAILLPLQAWHSYLLRAPGTRASHSSVNLSSLGKELPQIKWDRLGP